MSCKFIINLVVVVIVSINSISSVSAFTDVNPGIWYKEYADKLVAAGVIDGSRETFDASLHVTRDMAAKVVVIAAGYKAGDLITPVVPSFNDVPKSAWAYQYVETAKSLGFISGYGNRIYGPANKVSRAEFAAMINRAFKLEKNLDEAPHFSDVGTSDWFYDVVETVTHWSIVDGYSGGFFQPHQPINRAEMSKMIVRAMNVYKPVEAGKETEKVIVKEKIKKNNSSGVSPTSGIPDTTGGGTSGTIQNSFTENFSSFAPKYYVDEESFAPWFVKFAGFGLVGIESDTSNKWLRLSPQAVDSPGLTKASLVTGPAYQGPISFQSKLLTVKQLRTGSDPNSWEVAWVVWNYTDNDHFYYFIPKPNGWELGKRDPLYPGGQRFLATGESPLFPIGQWYTVKIEQDAANTITVSVNGSNVSTFTDTERPYGMGNIAFYTEDSEINVDDVSVTY